METAEGGVRVLTQEQRAFYEENGYVLVPGLLGRDEAQELRAEAHALIDRLSAGADLEATWGSAREMVGQATRTRLLHLPFEQYPLESAVPCPARAGDLLFFSYLTIHGSGLNVSQEARTTLLVQMRDPGDSPTDEGNWEPGQGLMLRGVAPGR